MGIVFLFQLRLHGNDEQLLSQVQRLGGSTKTSSTNDARRSKKRAAKGAAADGQIMYVVFGIRPVDSFTKNHPLLVREQRKQFAQILMVIGWKVNHHMSQILNPAGGNFIRNVCMVTMWPQLFIKIGPLIFSRGIMLEHHFPQQIETFWFNKVTVGVLVADAYCGYTCSSCQEQAHGLKITDYSIVLLNIHAVRISEETPQSKV